jgi:hypothetical protein
MASINISNTYYIPIKGKSKGGRAKTIKCAM